MKTTKLLLGMAFSLMLFSCGGGNNSDSDSTATEGQEQEMVLTPETTKVSGELGDAFVVVDKSYKPVKNMYTVITVEVERTNAEVPYDLETMNVEPFGYSGGDAHVGFGIEFLDNEGNILEKKSAESGSAPYSSDDVKELIKLKPGDKGTIRFSIYDSADKATKFRMSSAYQKVASSGSSSKSIENPYADYIKEGQAQMEKQIKEAQAAMEENIENAKKVYGL